MLLQEEGEGDMMVRLFLCSYWNQEVRDISESWDDVVNRADHILGSRRAGYCRVLGLFAQASSQQLSGNSVEAFYRIGFWASCLLDLYSI